MTNLPTPGPTGTALAPWEEQQSPTIYADGRAFDGAASESLLRHYWRIFYRRRWAVGTIVAACVGLALIVSMLSQRQYTATARIQVAREAAKVIDIESVESQETTTQSTEFYQTQYALLKSRSLAEAVVRSLGLADNHQFLANFDASKLDSFRELPREGRLKLATTMVEDRVAISPLRGSSVIDINVTVANPIMAATIANEFAEKFIETNLSRRFEASAYARQFLQNRLTSVRAKLEESERRATEYARAQGLINIGSTNADGQRSEQPLVTAELAQLSNQLALARAERERAEGQFRADSGGNAAGRSLINPAVNELRQQRAKTSAELRKLESDFGPEYPRVLALRAQLRELDKQVAQEESRVGSGVSRDLNDQFRQALAVEQGLQRRVDQLKRAVLDQQQRSIQFNIIQRDVDTNRALYEALLQRFKEVGVAGGIGTNNVSIVDSALPPERPSSPNLPLNLALGLFFGLALGAGVALALEQLSESVILPSDFQTKLGIPLLGSTPALRSGVRQKLLGSSFDGKSGETGKELLNPKSELSESYFSVLTAVQFSTTHGAPKSISVTSSQPGEGKSTTALALAKALAGAGARVLIIDGDMRNPSLHKSLGVQSGRGLSDVLTGKADLMEVVQSIDGIPVNFVTAGQLPPNPAELLSSGALDRTLNSAVASFDHVVVDSPPVLGLADALQIARATEGTVFVVESGRTRSTQARQAIERLMRVKSHLIGAVLTKLDSRSSGYGYGYGYNYSYGDA